MQKSSTPAPGGPENVLGAAGSTTDGQRPHAGLKPPQFRLSTMLWLVAAIGVVLTVMTNLSPIGAFALGLALLCVMIHVIGNVIGTRLREAGDRGAIDAAGDRLRARRAPVAVHEFAPATRLGRRQSLGWWLIAALLVGFVLGAGVGGGFLLQTYGSAATPMRLAIGGGAFGILGAFFGGLLGALVQVILLALWEAIRPARERKL